MSDLTTNLKVSPIFQKRLTELIYDLDCKKKDLSELLGVSKEVTARALNFGIIPKPVTLMKIADKFDISLEYLLGLSMNNNFDKTDNPKTFQIRLEELKAERKIKNNQICAKLPIDRSYFSIWKRENYIPSLEFLVMLADYFKVSLDYLLGRTDYKN